MSDRPALLRRFPQLAATLPWRGLGERPTPLRRLELLDAETGGVPVWVKDDGVFGSLWGGNKPRKLEWLLPDAVRRGRRTVVTAGGLATHHGLATALYARELGLRAVLLLVDQPVDDHARETFARIRGSGAVVLRTHDVPRTVAALGWVMLRYADRGRPPYWIPVGGSSPLGTLGFVDAGLELAEQVAAGELPEPSHVVCAFGSGGTAAGLLLGLRLGGLSTRVVAVAVNDRTRADEHVVRRLARRSADLLRRRGAEIPLGPATPGDLVVARGWLGPGYGHATAEGAAAAALAHRAGLELEPVYTAKAMAALLALAGEGRLGAGPVLYWHTHDAWHRPCGPDGI